MKAKPPSIALAECKSSNVAAYGYDAATRTLAVKFKTNGATHHYHDVSPDTHKALYAPKASVGSLVAKIIKTHKTTKP